MVMADRDGVRTASGPVTGLAVLGFAETMLNGLARVPFQKPLSGPSGLLDNIGQAVTKQTIRSFLGYAVSLPIEEYRSLEKVLDSFCGAVLPPVVGTLGSVVIEQDVVGGQHGIWCREKPEVIAEAGREVANPKTILYLHGGGYFGTTPNMYAMFAAALVRLTHCEVFIPDYRMSPEFPFPAGMHDAADVYQSLMKDRGIPSDDIIIAGDSGGGGLATSLMVYLHEQNIPKPRALVLFSPEVSLALDQPSIMDNMDSDVLPWNIPVQSYLRGVEPDDERVSIISAALQPEWFPPTFVCWGEKEMFRDGVRMFVQQLRDGDVPLVAMEEPGMFHVFPILMPWTEAAKRVFLEIEKLANRSHRPEGPMTVEEDAAWFSHRP
jgi:monoterpene epsilon-lactone hydrolase